MMNYDILTRNDFTQGMQLVVHIPEADLDEKALYTLRADRPDFLIPFQTTLVDGEYELVYTLANCTSIQYCCEEKTPLDYYSLFNSILTPILTCSDWFMTPSSFILRYEYLYITEDDTVLYLYVPSRVPASDSDDLRDLVSSIAENYKVTDSAVENQVLWQLNRNFQPAAFLETLKNACMDRAPRAAVVSPRPVAHNEQFFQQPGQSVIAEAKEAVMALPQVVAEAVQKPKEVRSADEGMELNWGNKSKEQKVKSQRKDAPKKQPQKKAKKEDEVENKPESKAKKSLLSGFRKNSAQAPVVAGASAEGIADIPSSNGNASAVPSPQFIFGDEKTQINDEEIGAVRLRYIGYSNFPNILPVLIDEGQHYTIGRPLFLSSSEALKFSRHHAAITLSNGQYMICDLNSLNGTFLNGKKLTPNMQYPLSRNDKVSFASVGADYIFEY